MLILGRCRQILERANPREHGDAKPVPQPRIFWKGRTVVDGRVDTVSKDQEISFVGRQPILDQSGDVFGYDLLFRDHAGASVATFEDAAQASAQVIVNSISSVGQDSVLGSAIGFIHADPNLLVAKHIESLPEGSLVVGVPALEKVTPEFEDRVRELYEKGLWICLDNFGYRDARACLLPYARFVKIDVTANDSNKVRKISRSLREHKVMQVACKVETLEAHEFVKKLGFDLFQGYFFAKPQLVGSKRLVVRRTRLLDLISNLENVENIDALVGEIREIPQLSINLLNLTRSISGHGSQKIESLRQAIVMVGEARLKDWLHLLLYAADDDRGCNNPLCEMAATRGKAMENLAALRMQRSGGDRKLEEQANLTGLLSLASPLFGVPLRDLVANLRVDDQIRAALLEREGELGKLLSLSERLEENDTESVQELLEALDLTPSDLENCQMEAMRWSSGLQSATEGSSQSVVRERSFAAA